MTGIKWIIGTLCTYTVYYAVLIIRDYHGQNHTAINVTENIPEAAQNSETRIAARVIKPGSILNHDTLLQSLWAYDNSDHKHMVHIRLDKQTIDLLNKFKIATSTDITKFVAFAVKYLFETNPELKTIIIEYFKNTEL